ncbi:MAG: TonB-dependent receptor [Novosphingobium sp.]
MANLVCGSAALALFAPLAFSASAAAAQGTAPESKNTGRDDTATQLSETAITDIIVTADRRSSRLQDTPLAITAFDSGTVERDRIQSVADLVPRIPGFSINSASRSRLNPALRGGSSALSAPGSDQAVALFVDEVYYGSAGDFNLDLFDIERVEVLRGPQGTLNGRNSTGGSISIVTKEPRAQLEGGVEASLGNYGLVEARGFVTSALDQGENLLGSLAFTTTKRSGTSYNRTLDRRIDDVDRTSIRGKLKWLISDDASLLLAGDYSRVNETGEGRKFIGASPLAAPYVADPDSRVTDQYSNGGYHSKSWGISARFEKNFDIGTLTSISAFRKARSSELPNDQIGQGHLIFAFAEARKLDQFSQEVRFASDLDGRFNFVGGVFFLYQKESRDISWFWQHDPATLAGVQQALFFCQPDQDIDPYTVNPNCLATRPELFQPGEAHWYQLSNVYSYAAFLQANYKITPEVTLIAGGRFTIDRKTVQGYVDGDLSFAVNQIENPGFMGTAGGYSVARKSKRWSAFTPRVTLDWKPSRNLMLYATVSRGYRSGAFQIENDPSVPALEPEFVWNYEAGFKSRFLDNRVQLNVAAFNAQYSNLQFQFTDDNGNSSVSNAGKARVRGIETELTVNPVRGLSLGANYSYQKGRVTNIPVQTGIPNGINTGQTPKHSLNLTGVYEAELANGGSVTLSADWQYKSKYQLELNDDPAFSSKTPGLLNGSIAYRTPNEKWTFTLWGKNLTNKDVVIFGNDFRFFSYSFGEAFDPSSSNFDPAKAGSKIVRYAAPRTYGVTARMSF